MAVKASGTNVNLRLRGTAGDGETDINEEINGESTDANANVSLATLSTGVGFDTTDGGHKMSEFFGYTSTVSPADDPNSYFAINTYTGTNSSQNIQGKIGTAASFNGSSSYISTASAHQSNFSVSAWVYANSLTENNWYGSRKDSSNLMIIGIDASGKIKVFKKVSNTWYGFTTTSTHINANTWHHVVVNFTSSNTKIYVDGTDINNDHNNHTTSVIYGDSYIGATNTTSVGSYWNGKIDQVRIFDKALSSSEVTQLASETYADSTRSTTDIFSDGSGVALYEFENGGLDTGGVSGKFGSGAIFNGSSSNITITSEQNTPIDLTQESFSISMWFNTNTISSDQALISRWGTSAGTGRAILFNIRSSDSKINLLEADGSTNYSLQSNTVLSANTWYHFLYTRNATTSKLYINGQLDRSDTRTNAINSGSTTPFKIGSQHGNLKFFDGKIDQVRIFNTDVSASVSTIYNESGADLSTTDILGDGSGVALYQLDGDATDTGSYPYGSGTIDSGNSSVFNGSNTYITLPSGLSSEYQGSSVFSVSAWIYLTTSGYNPIFTHYNSNYSVGGINFHVNSNNKIQFTVFTSTDLRKGSYGSTTLATNTWYHVTAVWNNNTIYLYVNGNQESTTNSFTTYTGSTIPSNTTNSSKPNRIGTVQFSDGSYVYFNGRIDDLRLYDSALSNTQIGYIVENDTVNIPTANLFAHYKLDGNATDQTGNYSGTYSGTESYANPASKPLAQYNGTATNVSYAYDGTATNVKFEGTAFQPDLVWVKNRTGTNAHALVDSVRGRNAYIFPNLTLAELNTSTSGQDLTSFDSNGFTVGTVQNAGSTNASGGSIVAWCWKAGGTAVSNTDGVTAGSVTAVTSQVSANQDAGFSICQFTTPSSGKPSWGHGLSQSPELIIVKKTDDTGPWFIYAPSILGQKELRFTTAAATSYTPDFISADSSKINLGSSTFNIAGSAEHINYNFHSVDGYQKIGGYSGLGTSPITIATGFKPRFLLIRRYDSTGGNWYIYDQFRDGTNDRQLYANSSAQESTTADVITYNSYGFTVASSGSGVNASSSNYIYLAIA